MASFSSFALDAKFVAAYKDKVAPFGFNGLGKLVYDRTYSRLKEDGSREQWWETVLRVVNGCFGMQKRWILSEARTWNESKAQGSAQVMYDRIFNMKFLPPGKLN